MTNIHSSLVTLVGEKTVLSEEEEDEASSSSVEDEDGKWVTFVKGEDGLLYGIPHGARRVVKFNPIDNSMGGTDWTCASRSGLDVRCLVGQEWNNLLSTPLL